MNGFCRFFRGLEGVNVWIRPPVRVCPTFEDLISIAVGCCFLLTRLHMTSRLDSGESTVSSPLVMGPPFVFWLGLSASMKTGPTHAAMQQHLGRGGLLKVGGPGMEFEYLTGDLMIVDDRPGDKPSNKVVLARRFRFPFISGSFCLSEVL